MPGRRAALRPGAGAALGADLISDGNIGACASNAACAAACATACGGPAQFFAAACTGRCSGPVAQLCTTDAACAMAGNGACNGPEPVQPSQNNICQCGCLDGAAHGAGDPGDLQCRLRANLVVENLPPCDGVDVRINVGESCIPLTTTRATGLIVDANFTPASQVPAAPNVNDQSGSPVGCGTLDASTATGVNAVGLVNFFGSALGDISAGLRIRCQ